MRHGDLRWCGEQGSKKTASMMMLASKKQDARPKVAYERRRCERITGQPSPRKARSPHRCVSFLSRVFPRERRYADLGYLLPMFPIELAVKPGVSALPLGTPSTYILPRFGQSAIPRMDCHFVA